ncbi:GntR family transcriptional regulator [Streptomyces sp. NPDC005496]|uniref:GntR family transcriptional regulator n=1 Tax=Streptomyces sp. NPDC005496 TaxID=3364716 RepID=UPI0036A85FB0
MPESEPTQKGAKVSTSIDLLPPLRRPASRTDRVRDALRQAILEGSLPPGRPLVERELAEMLGVSKTPVREALKQLRFSGLVSVNALQGVSVRSSDAETARQLYTARLATEPAAVRMAVDVRGAGARPSARQALADAAASMDDADVTGLGLANRRFHRTLYIGCANTWLHLFLDQLQDLTAVVAARGWRLHATFQEEAAEHAAILHAVESGNAGMAELLMHAHIEKAKHTVLAALDHAERAST